jgi:CheY-like chemotaxis protein
LRKERVTLASVFDHAIETCQPLLDTTSHTVNIELPTDNIMLEGDPVRLSQIFGNLLNNAAKYTKPGGTITVTAIVSADCVAVSIKDTGEGISVEMLPRVFDLFSQVDRTLQRSEGGLGIGLALVRGLVQLHGGKVEAMSKGIGQGSEFIVTLPLAQNTMEDHSIHENIASLTIAPRRILIVDDNHDAADSLGLILNSLGYSVKVVYAGTVALECLQAFDPHVVLLDIGMPVIDGLETARRIRHIPKFATTPLIALTGWGQDADRERTKAAGFTHHLVKPVDFNEVNALLKAMQTVE